MLEKRQSLILSIASTLMLLSAMQSPSFAGSVGGGGGGGGGGGVGPGPGPAPAAPAPSAPEPAPEKPTPPVFLPPAASGPVPGSMPGMTSTDLTRLPQPQTSSSTNHAAGMWGPWRDPGSVKDAKALFFRAAEIFAAKTQAAAKAYGAALKADRSLDPRYSEGDYMAAHENSSEGWFPPPEPAFKYMGMPCGWDDSLSTSYCEAVLKWAQGVDCTGLLPWGTAGGNANIMDPKCDYVAEMNFRGGLYGIAKQPSWNGPRPDDPRFKDPPPRGDDDLKHHTPYRLPGEIRSYGPFVTKKTIEFHYMVNDYDKDKYVNAVNDVTLYGAPVTPDLLRKLGVNEKTAKMILSNSGSGDFSYNCHRLTLMLATGSDPASIIPDRTGPEMLLRLNGYSPAGSTQPYVPGEAFVDEHGGHSFTLMTVNDDGSPGLVLERRNPGWPPEVAHFEDAMAECRVNGYSMNRFIPPGKP